MYRYPPPSAHPVGSSSDHFHHRFFRRSRLLVPFSQVTNPACPTSTYLPSFFPNFLTSTYHCLLRFTLPFVHKNFLNTTTSSSPSGKEDLTASCSRTPFQCHIFFTIDRELRFSQITYTRYVPTTSTTITTSPPPVTSLQSLHVSASHC